MHGNSDPSDDEDNYYTLSEEDDSSEEFGVEGQIKSRIHLYCDICDVKSLSFQNLQNHFAGSKHKKKLEISGLSTELTEYLERPKTIDIWNSIMKCQLCKLVMVGADILIHAKSELHTRRLKAMSKRSQDFYMDVSNCFKPVEIDEYSREEERRGRFVCEMCKVELSGKEHLELHLNGKKHQRKERWLQISKDPDSSECRQVWCSFCRVFVTNVTELDLHFAGKQHVRKLKKAGVKWKVLVDLYGEDCVGGLPPEPQRSAHFSRSRHSPRDGHISPHSVKRENSRSPAHSSHSRPQSSGEKHASCSTDPTDSVSSGMRNHSTSSQSRSTHSSKDSSPALSPVQFTPLPHPKWDSLYSTLPTYDLRLPQVLRQGWEHKQGKAIFQSPLLAVGDFVRQVGKEEPLLTEMDTKTKNATSEREAKEREEERRMRGRGDDWRSGHREIKREPYSYRERRDSWREGTHRERY